MKLYLAVFLFMVLSVIWNMITNEKWRRILMPWCLAILLMNMACATFYSGMMRVWYTLSNFFCYMVLCDGFGLGKRGKNSLWMLFMVFWAYMLVACFFGYYSFVGILYWIKIIFTTYCCGYYVARWVVRSEGALRQISIAFTVTGGITLLLYLRHGGMTVMDVDQGMRAGLDATTLSEDMHSNANYTAACMTYLMIFLVFAIVRPIRTQADTWLRWISAIEFVLAGTMMVRCGSRGAVIGLLPAVLFVISSKGGQLKQRVKIGAMVVVAMAMLASVYFVMRNVESLRAFSLTQVEDGDFYGTVGDRITTGRMSMWKDHLSMMTPIDCMIGRGFTKQSMMTDIRTGRTALTAGNAHSMYMTVFYHAGSIGIFIFLFYILVCLRRGMKMGLRGHVALVFFGAWVLMGIGESAGMTGTFLGVIGGIGCGLLTQGPAANSEFGERNYFWPMMG